MPSLDILNVNQLRILAKNARINPSGSREELITRLRKHIVGMCAGGQHAFLSGVVEMINIMRRYLQCISAHDGNRKKSMLENALDNTEVLNLSNWETTYIQQLLDLMKETEKKLPDPALSVDPRPEQQSQYIPKRISGPGRRRRQELIHEVVIRNKLDIGLNMITLGLLYLDDKYIPNTLDLVKMGDEIILFENLHGKVGESGFEFVTKADTAAADTAAADTAALLRENAKLKAQLAAAKADAPEAEEKAKADAPEAEEKAKAEPEL